MDVEVPIADSSAFTRLLTALIGLTAVVAAVLTLLDLDSHRKEARYAGQSTRTAVALGESAAIRTAVLRYEATAIQGVAGLKAKADSRQSSTAVDQLVVGAAEENALAEVKQQQSKLIGFPINAKGKARLAAESNAAQAKLLRFGKQLDALGAQRTRYARRGTRASLALSLTAIAGALLGLAAVLGAGRPGRIVLAAGLLALVAAGAGGIWAVLG
jgi:hypothetical protein